LPVRKYFCKLDQESAYLIVIEKLCQD
jgi:hypothetical protein